ncbi:MAG TPA: tetratricopeptide repeat protein [Balneolaceae bacterium]|nr:tetratricopeptide repeat protein [Balneolaceae bacterium]
MRKPILHILLLFWMSSLLFWDSPSAKAQNKQSINDREFIQAQSAYIDGLAAFENEDYQKALQLLKTAYLKLPDLAGVNYALADTYLQLNDLTNAMYFGKQAAKLNPQNKWYHLKMVDIYQATGNNEAVIEQLNTALNYHPTDTDILYELAQTYTDDDSLSKANQVYNQILRLEGSSISIHLQKLKNFDDLGLQDSAIVELQEIQALDPDNLATLHVLSNYYLDMDRVEDAKKVLHDALQINRKDPKTLTMLTDIYMQEGKWDSLGTMIGQVVADSSVSAKNKMDIVQYLYSNYNDDPGNAGLRDATGHVLQQFMKNEPENAHVQELAADFFAQTNQNELALRALKKTNELMPSNDSAWHQRLQLLLVENRVKEAITVGQQAAKEIPQDPIILYFLGSAYLSNHENQKALDNFKEASTLPARKPLKASIYSGIGSAYAGLEKWEQVFDNYEQSLKFNPDNPGVLNNYAYYLSIQKQDLEKAKKMAERAIKLDPENASYLDTIGWVYYQMGKYKEAKKYIQQALDTGKASAEVMEHMGDIMNKLQNTQKAKYWWRKALEKDSTRTYLKAKISI